MVKCARSGFSVAVSMRVRVRLRRTELRILWVNFTACRGMGDMVASELHKGSVWIKSVCLESS